MKNLITKKIRENILINKRMLLIEEITEIAGMMIKNLMKEPNKTKVDNMSEEVKQEIEEEVWPSITMIQATFVLKELTPKEQKIEELVDPEIMKKIVTHQMKIDAKINSNHKFQ